MAPFRFRLQKILDYRQRLEDEARMALLQAEAQVRDAQTALHEITTQRVQAQAQFRQECRTAHDMWLWQPYLQYLEERQSQAQRRLDELTQAAASRRQELQQRSVERKLLEKLRERHHTRHLSEENRRDQCLLDEAAILAFCDRER